MSQQAPPRGSMPRSQPWGVTSCVVCLRDFTRKHSKAPGNKICKPSMATCQASAYVANRPCMLMLEQGPYRTTTHTQLYMGRASEVEATRGSTWSPGNLSLSETKNWLGPKLSMDHVFLIMYLVSSVDEWSVSEDAPHAVWALLSRYLEEEIHGPFPWLPKRTGSDASRPQKKKHAMETRR